MFFRAFRECKWFKVAMVGKYVFFASGTHDFQDLVIVSSEHPSIPLENEGRTELENNHEWKGRIIYHPPPFLGRTAIRFSGCLAPKFLVNMVLETGWDVRRVISSDFGEFGGTTVGHHVPPYQLISLPPSGGGEIWPNICTTSCLPWKKMDNDILFFPTFNGVCFRYFRLTP